MKLGICYNMYTERVTCYGDEKFRKLKEFGFDCVDFGLTDTKNPLYTLPIEEAKEILLKEKSLAEEAGISIWQTHGPWCWPPPETNPEAKKRRLEEMKRSALMTSILGSKYMVIHPIMPFLTEEKGTELEPETRRENFEFMRALLAYAKECGVTICLENMPMYDFTIATPSDILEFVKEIDDENFQICLDTGHVAVYEDLDLAEETGRLGKYLKVMHAHDNIVGPDIHLLPYSGRIDWKAYAKALKDIEFDGVFNMELVIPDKLPIHLRENMHRHIAAIGNHIVNE